MGTWLWQAWLQVWPNLAANILWVPAAAAHHVLMKRHTARQLAAHAQQQGRQLAGHIAAAVQAVKEDVR